MTRADEAVVHREMVVDAPIAHAFATFVERFGDFKPPEHNLLGAPIARTTFESRVRGQIYDVAEDGSECRRARSSPTSLRTESPPDQSARLKT